MEQNPLGKTAKTALCAIMERVCNDKIAVSKPVLRCMGGRRIGRLPLYFRLGKMRRRLMILVNTLK